MFDSTGFSIGEVTQRTGVAEGTLRMWERRHGFPAPRRLPSGRRAYSEHDIERVRRVASDRAAGLALRVAIDRATAEAEPPASLYALLRRRRPDLEARTFSKPTLVALSQAIEDESLSRAERPLLFASFQRERFYRRAQARWRELARGAQLALVFADFPRLRLPRSGGPVEVPVDRDHPLTREWGVVCIARGHAACLVGWEPPGSATGPAADRAFATIWSVEPAVVRAAAAVCVEIAGIAWPERAADLAQRVEAYPSPPANDQLRLAAAITARTLADLSA